MQAIEVKRVNWRIDDDLMTTIAERAEAAQTSQNAIANTLLREAIGGRRERQESEERIERPDALPDMLRHIYLSAEAALQAVAYQRDHPNLPADEIVAHSRTAAARRMLTHEWPER